LFCTNGLVGRDGQVPSNAKVVCMAGDHARCVCSAMNSLHNCDVKNDLARRKADPKKRTMRGFPGTHMGLR
jgi:hypothetical protein